MLPTTTPSIAFMQYFHVNEEGLDLKSILGRNLSSHLLTFLFFPQRIKQLIFFFHLERLDQRS